MNENQSWLADLFSHPGWLMTLFATTWGIILRALIGRYVRLNEEAARQRELWQATVTDINQRLSNIEGQLTERARGGSSGRYRRPPPQ